MTEPGSILVGDLPLVIHRSEVLHFLEYPAGHEPRSRVAALVDELLPEARALARGRGCYRALDIGDAARIGLEPVPAAALVVGLVTVGAGIETRASELGDRGEVTRALVLDAAGSAAAEEAADRLGALIAQPTGGAGATLPAGAAAEPVAALPCRLSPGYGRWDVTCQHRLFALLRHRDVGVELLPSSLMVPRKSISFAMWLGAEGPIRQGLAGCSRCALEHCRYRRSPRQRHANSSTPTSNRTSTEACP